MAKHLLTDVRVRNAKSRAKPYRLFDGDGLALWISPSGARSWQFRYKLNGRPQTLTIGKLSTYTLAEARERAEEARKLHGEGKHLTTAKRVARAKVAADDASTFEANAASWIRKHRSWSAAHRAQVRASIDNHLASLKPLPVTEITARLVAPILAKVERRAPLMFEKVRRRLHRVMDHAVTLGALERNPLPAPEPERRNDRRHFPAVTDLVDIGEILRKARAADPAKGVTRAHLLVAFTAQRIAEVAGAAWIEFDLEGASWTIPRERMKVRKQERGPHIIPIPRQLLAELKQWHAADGRDAVLVCAAPRDPSRPITPEGVEKFYRDVLELAGKHSPHSWRSVFKTIAADAGKDSEVIEAQLDHVVGNKVASAYDRAKRLELRRKLMQWYEGALLEARDGAEVVPLKRGLSISP